MQVLQFLIDTLFFCLIAACLLRAWMNSQQIRLAQQPGPFVMALTDWLVTPLRRILPRSVAQSNLDGGSLLAALLLSLAYGVVVWLVWLGGDVTLAFPMVLSMGLRILVRSALQLVMLLAFAYAVLSWVQPRSPVMYVLTHIVEPLVRPLRRFVPTIGGVDLSVLVLIMLAQVGLMLVG